MNHPQENRQPWILEFGAKWQVPPQIDALVGSGLLADESWHNDSCPRFSHQEGNNVVILSVDHVDPAQREYEPVNRFQVWIQPCDSDGCRGLSAEYVYDGDDVDEAIRVTTATVERLRQQP